MSDDEGAPSDSINAAALPVAATDGWRGDLFRAAVYDRALNAFFADRNRWAQDSGRRKFELSWEQAEAQITAIATALAWKDDPQRWFEVASMLRHFADLVDGDGLRSLSWGRWGGLDVSARKGGPDSPWTSGAQTIYNYSYSEQIARMRGTFADAERMWSEDMVAPLSGILPNTDESMLVNILVAAIQRFYVDGPMSNQAVENILRSVLDALSSLSSTHSDEPVPDPAG